jgi:hypothetical protein
MKTTLGSVYFSTELLAGSQFQYANNVRAYKSSTKWISHCLSQSNKEVSTDAIHSSCNSELQRQVAALAHGSQRLKFRWDVWKFLLYGRLFRVAHLREAISLPIQ